MMWVGTMTGRQAGKGQSGRQAGTHARTRHRAAALGVEEEARAVGGHLEGAAELEAGLDGAVAWAMVNG